ncbi:MAG: NPCBM/NEW2 domain-containing protein [Planctomycetota bacterium]
MKIDSMFSVLFCTMCITVCGTALADEILLYDGKKITGEIRAIDSKSMTVQVGDASRIVNIFDVTSYQFIQPALPEKVSQLLIDGEKPSYAQGPRTAKVKLRKGFHRFTLPYYHTVGLAKLNITLAGPGMKNAEVPKEMLYRVNDEVRAIPSKDYLVDQEGFRLPLNLTKTEQYVAYRLMEWKPAEQVKSMQDLKSIPVKKYGASPRLALLTQRSAINFGFVYEGVIKIPQDGEYTFSIETDKNSKVKFYVGAYPSELFKQAKSKKDSGWQVKYLLQGELTGNIREWNKERAVFSIPMAEKEVEISLKPAAVHELWKLQSDPKKSWRADRKGEPETEDSAYVLTKDGNVQRVSGEVLGLKDQNLLFLYQEQEREVNLDRIVGLVLHKNRIKKTSNLALQSLVNLIGGAQIPGEVSLENGTTVTIKMPWGDQFSLPKEYLASVKTINARSVPLTELKPDSVTQVPFFNQAYPYQTNKSFTGQPLKIREKVFQQGLCVHSRTELVYALEKNFEQFHSAVGLQEGSGQLGNVAVKIVADGKTLFENPEFTSETKQEPLNLDVTGCQTLTLIVDFGKGQDVGDRFVWGDPKLIRATPKELAANKND